MLSRRLSWRRRETFCTVQSTAGRAERNAASRIEKPVVMVTSSGVLNRP